MKKICTAILIALTGCNTYKAMEIDGTNMMSTMNDWKSTIKIQCDNNIERNSIVVVHLDGETICMRVAGLPGDEICIDSNRLYVNGSLVQFPKTCRFVYRLVYKDRSVLVGKGDKIVQHIDDTTILLFSSIQEVKELETQPFVSSVSMFIHSKSDTNHIDTKKMIPISYNISFMKLFYIPTSVTSQQNSELKLYPKFIQGRSDKYYFLMNDNFEMGNDSRRFGLISRDSIVGTVIKIIPKEDRTIRLDFRDQYKTDK